VREYYLAEVQGQAGFSRTMFVGYGLLAFDCMFAILSSQSDYVCSCD
jgi:TfoX/Sxy family transcriptional regulator of competence genes